MKKIFIVLFVSALFTLVSSCEKKDDNNTGHEVGMTGSVFNPATLTISAGSVVTWTNDDNIAHTVTDNNGNFNSGNMQPGATFQFTFTTKGSYDYKCTYHTPMVGKIIVE